MYSGEDRTTAFRCNVAPEYSEAKVVIGWKTCDVRVCEVARDSFTLIVPKSLLKKTRQGSKFELRYRDEAWIVQCTSQEIAPEGFYQIHAQRLQDLTKMEYRSSFFWWLGSNQVEVRHRDPILPVGIIAAFLLIVLIMPGLGDDLGTSSFLSDFFGSAARTVKETFFGP